MEEAVESEDLEFKWGKKKSIGGKKKDVQFYESFTYDGDEYRLYDCVLVGDASEPDSTEPFVGMIIKIWEHADKHIPRKVKLLWFFKPSEIAPYLEGVPDVLANELFLASGEGHGLTNINQLEAIGGKCSVLCISKDKRNPQPSDEKIKSTDFVFRRAFDVGSCKVVDKLDDKIAGVDVKFIFNRAGCEKEATAVQKTEADINGNSDSLKPNGPLASGSDRKIGDTSIESSDCKESSYGCKQEKEKGHYQLATKKSTLAEERFNKDSGSGGNHGDGVAQESEVKKQFIKQKSMPPEGRYSSSCEASGSREIHSNSKKAQVNDVKKQLTKQKSIPAEGRYNKESNGLDDRPLKKQKLDGSATVPDGRNTTSLQNITSDGVAQESEVKKQFIKQKSMPAEGRHSSSCEASGSREIHSNSKKAQVNDVKKQLTKQKSMPAEGRYNKESNGLDDRPLKKQKLDGSATVPDGRNTTSLQNITSDGKQDSGTFKRPRDKMKREEVPPEKPSFVKKRDLGVLVSEGKDTKTATEKCLSKKPRFERAEDKILADYQVIEVSRRPDAEKINWFRSLPWKESMRDAEKKGTVVLLQNLDPTYTSDEVEDIVYSALNEQCEARMIERTSVTVPHIGEALVIFKTREVAERVIRRLDKGCLLLSNGRPLVAVFAKITPPGKPSLFSGHIKLHKTHARREMRDAVATSHGAQPNNLEFDMAMEWCLHQARHELSSERRSKRQLEEIRSLRINFKPKLP